MVAKRKKSGMKKSIKKPTKIKKVKKIIVKKTSKKLAKKPLAKKTVKKKKLLKHRQVKKSAVNKAKKVIQEKAKEAKKIKKTKKTSIGQRKKVMTVKMVRETQQPAMQAVSKPTTLLGALEFTPYPIKENELYMNDHQKDHFRKILDAWKQQLMQDVDLTVGHLKEEAVFYADPVDRASQEEGFNLELRTRDRERRLIKKIEQSLDLINTGEYGFCEDCGAEIGVRRLEARPTAVKCIDCKTFQEIREKQLGG